MDLPPAAERSPRHPVRAWGRIESLLPGHRCTVLMPNGFRAEAHPDKSCRADPPVLAVGDPVYLEFSTYDLSNPRIIPQGALGEAHDEFQGERSASLP